MSLPVITSAHNPRVKAAARLRDRRGREKQQRIIIDGVREISRTLDAGIELIELYFCDELCHANDHRELIARARGAGADILSVSESVMQKLAFGDRAEGVVAVARTPLRTLEGLLAAVRATAGLPSSAAPPIDTAGRASSGTVSQKSIVVAVLEGVEKPGNLGAVLRTADAAGVAALIVADGGTDLYNPNAIRASLGAIFTVPVCAATSRETLAWLRGEKFRILTARVDAAIDYAAASYSGRTAIVLGSEALGLTDVWRGDDITAIKLPMLGQVDSLNLSATAAVLFYEALRQASA